jgi:hypothetical protein
MPELLAAAQLRTRTQTPHWQAGLHAGLGSGGASAA